MPPDIARAINVMKPLNGLLVCSGLAALRDEHQHSERLPCGGGTWLGRTVQAAERGWHGAALRGPFVQLPPHRCLWLYAKSWRVVSSENSGVRATLRLPLGTMCKLARALHVCMRLVV